MAIGDNNLGMFEYLRSTNIAYSKHGTLLYVASLVFAAAAMLSKETGVTVLGVSVIYDSVVTNNSLR